MSLPDYFQHYRSFQNYNLDHLIRSPNASIHFNGFHSNLYELRKRGWEISYENNFYRDNIFFILAKGELTINLSVERYELMSSLDHQYNGIEFSLVGIDRKKQYVVESEQDFIKCQEALLEYQAKKLKDKMTDGFNLDQELKNVG